MLAMTEGRPARPDATGGARRLCYGLAGLWLLLAVGLPLRGFTVDNGDGIAVAVAAGLLAMLAACLRARRLHGLATMVEAWTLFALACLTFTLLTFLVGAGHMPLVDPALARADRFLFPGLDWAVVMRQAGQEGVAAAWANTAYESIRWQPNLLIALLCLAGRYRACWSFLAAWVATLSVATIVFGVLPSLGPYPTYGMEPADVPGVHVMIAWTSSGALTALRSGALRHIALDSLDGIVIFPSFHASACVLLTRFAWPLRWARWPFLVGNAAMLVATAPVGGHYFTDLLGGVAAAILGLLVARRCCPA